MLERLESIPSPEDLRRADYRVHLLTRDRKGFPAVETSGTWRVVFRFKDGNACNVESASTARI